MALKINEIIIIGRRNEKKKAASKHRKYQ